MQTVETKLLLETPKRTYRTPVTLGYENDRIFFLKSPFGMKDEIKAMQGSKWHGFIEGDNRKIWSVADSHRNRFQMAYLQEKNPYAWFDRDIIEHEYPQFGSPEFGYFDLMSQQKLMANTGLTYHYQIWGAEMGVGKTLAAIAMMKLSGHRGFWWVGPKSSLYGIRQEFDKWGLEPGTVTDMMSYEAMLTKLRTWRSGDPAPIGVIFDESQRLKTPTAQRTQAAQKLADAIRSEYGMDGFVILMTGTPSPKSPGDWWAPCEIACPGFIREGSRDAFEQRMGFFRLQNNLSGHAFNTRVAWKDNSDRCDKCGHYLEEGHHMTPDGEVIDADPEMGVHVWEPSFNEVADLPNRLQGLVTIVHKKDCLELPDKIYKTVLCEPTPSVNRVASALLKTAPNVITGLTWLRELSDGFQYREIQDGEEPCSACEDGTEVEHYHPNDDGATITEVDLLSDDFVSELESRTVKCRTCKGKQVVPKMVRVSREVPCPKEDALIDLLDQAYEQKRIGIFAGFTGSLDRIIGICHKQGWDTIRVDGRGWLIEQLTGMPNEDGTQQTKRIRLDNPMDYWIQNPGRRIAFVAHPKSGGVSLTLCPQANRPGATMLVFYSNDFDPSSRSQAEDRIHRTGMDTVKGATIVDLIHLSTDERVLAILKQNRKLELMSMGDFEKDYE